MHTHRASTGKERKSERIKATIKKNVFQINYEIVQSIASHKPKCSNRITVQTHTHGEWLGRSVVRSVGRVNALDFFLFVFLSAPCSAYWKKKRKKWKIKRFGFVQLYLFSLIRYTTETRRERERSQWIMRMCATLCEQSYVVIMCLLTNVVYYCVALQRYVVSQRQRQIFLFCTRIERRDSPNELRNWCVCGVWRFVFFPFI